MESARKTAGDSTVAPDNASRSLAAALLEGMLAHGFVPLLISKPCSREPSWIPDLGTIDKTWVRGQKWWHLVVQSGEFGHVARVREYLSVRS